MEHRTAEFMGEFRKLIDEVMRRRPVPEGLDPLPPALAAHLGVPAHSLPVVMEETAPHRYVDADIALADLARRDPSARLLGIGGGDQRHHASFSDIVQQSMMYGQFPLGQVDYTNQAVGPDEERQVVALGLRLFHYRGVPMAVFQRAAGGQPGRASAGVGVLCPAADAVAGFLAELRAGMLERSALRGKVISFSPNAYGPGAGGVSFLRRPDLTAAEVILPEGTLAEVSAHVLGIAEHRALLRSHRQHLKRGVLLYGPPGTGKTHTVRYLLSRSEGVTAVVLSGGSLRFVAEAARTAKALQPAIVVLEDCDLIAEDRNAGNGPQPLLFEVLDAMDGLDPDADVAFLLTTNRPQALERALAQRPGRVDLAVEIPLPTEPERLRLLALYAAGTELSQAALAEAARATEGTTASFAKELVRRAVLRAALSAEDLDDSHLAAATEMLLAAGQTLTRSLLGVPTDDGARGSQPAGVHQPHRGHAGPVALG